MELPSQVRKPMSTEEEHYLSEDSIQKKKRYKAGPGVGGKRIGPRPGGTLKARCRLSPSWELWPSFNYLQVSFPAGLSTSAAWLCPANELSGMGELATATLY